MINLVLIDDHVMIHDAVRFQLAGLSDIALVGTGTAGEEIEPLIERYQPDVIVIDLSIPPFVETNVRTAGRYPVLPAVRRLRKNYPATKFMILSGDVTASRHFFRDFIRYGNPSRISHLVTIAHIQPGAIRSRKCFSLGAT
jgi:DNA-binding NarL/FixJ family response regulator